MEACGRVKRDSRGSCDIGGGPESWSSSSIHTCHGVQFGRRAGPDGACAAISSRFVDAALPVPVPLVGGLAPFHIAASLRWSLSAPVACSCSPSVAEPGALASKRSDDSRPRPSVQRWCRRHSLLRLPPWRARERGRGSGKRRRTLGSKPRHALQLVQTSPPRPHHQPPAHRRPIPIPSELVRSHPISPDPT